ncbi:MAG: hypothetical protein COW67_01985 [Flavobacteriales bacterium CG18_big_fil_WC_8_21_14_2_50_32_9]|nr:MAG: hypothetical protein COW67_01985 [Flavobacteriales bacterium CG18_big_fil_WC_8_21_14_2_50_32_9]
MRFLKHLFIVYLIVATHILVAQENKLQQLAIVSAEHSKQVAFFISQNLTEENTSADLLKNYNDALIACEKALIYSDSAINNINDSSFSEKVAKIALKNTKKNQEKTIAILEELTALSEEFINQYSPKEALYFINNAIVDAYQASIELNHGKVLPIISSSPNQKIEEATPVIEKVPELIYKVQLGLFRKKIEADYFGTNFTIMFEEVEKGVWRYSIDGFTTYETASEAKKIIKEKGYDAFIVPMFKGERIAIEKALSIEKQTK